MRSTIIMGVLGLLLSSTPLIACDGSSAVEQQPASLECTGALNGGPAYACLAMPGSMPMPTSSLAFAFSGTVEEVIEGARSSCQFSIGQPPLKGQKVWRARVRDGEREAWIDIAWDRPLLSVGERISIFARQSGMALLNNPSTLTPYATEVRDRDGRLIYWLASAHSMHTLGVPEEIGVSDGSSCVADVHCGRVERRGLHVRVDGHEGELDYGQQADFPPFTVVHAGNEHTLETSGRCFDWLSEDVTVAAARLPAALDAGSCDVDGGCAP